MDHTELHPIISLVPMHFNNLYLSTEVYAKEVFCKRSNLNHRTHVYTFICVPVYKFTMQIPALMEKNLSKTKSRKTSEGKNHHHHPASRRRSLEFIQMKDRRSKRWWKEMYKNIRHQGRWKEARTRTHNWKLLCPSSPTGKQIGKVSTVCPKDHPSFCY